MIALLDGTERSVSPFGRARQDGFGRGRNVAQRAVWSDRVVVVSPSSDEHCCLLQSVEDFAVQQLVAELAVERFVVAVLPGAAWFDVERLHADPAKPIPNGMGRELRTIVGTNVVGWAVFDKQCGNALQDVIGFQLSIDLDGQTPPGKFVDYGQHAESPTVMGSVHDEVVGPDMVRPTRAQADA